MRPRGSAGRRARPAGVSQLPNSWEAATSDGQRWRWALAQAAENRPAANQRDTVAVRRISLAAVWRPDHGWHRFFGRTADDGRQGRERHLCRPYARRERDDRAAGDRASSGSSCPTNSTSSRFFSRSPSSRRRDAARTRCTGLAEIFENRRQYSKGRRILEAEHRAVRAGKRDLEERASRTDRRQLGTVRVLQVAASRTGSAQRRFHLPQRDAGGFRRARNQHCKLLDDVEGIPEIQAAAARWQQVEIENIGWRLVDETRNSIWATRRRSGPKSSSRAKPLRPPRSPSTTPLKKPGAYLLTARVPGRQRQQDRRSGWPTRRSSRNSSRQIALLSSPTPSAAAPVAKADVEFFGSARKCSERNRYGWIREEFHVGRRTPRGR